jgi:hypothetical protein
MGVYYIPAILDVFSVRATGVGGIRGRIATFASLVEGEDGIVV